MQDPSRAPELTWVWDNEPVSGATSAWGMASWGGMWSGGKVMGVGGMRCGGPAGDGKPEGMTPER